MIPLAIADLAVELHVPASRAGEIRQRYKGFARSPSSGTSTPPLRLFAFGAPASSRIGAEALPRVEVTLLDPTRIALGGDCAGEFDLQARRGEIEGPDVLAAMDALLRLALSLLAPQEGWLLLHGAAIAMRDGRWALVLGRSGAGKSTAARAFRSFCDELVLARPGGPAACEAASTPYWGGRPRRGTCGALVCLERGPRGSGDPGVQRLRGADAVRALAPHAVRHVRLERSEEDTMTRLCALACDVPVFDVCCPVGPAFVPFLTRALHGLGCVPLAHRPNARERRGRDA